jgi:hypothetical protein
MEGGGEARQTHIAFIDPLSRVHVRPRPRPGGSPHRSRSPPAMTDNIGFIGIVDAMGMGASLGGKREGDDAARNRRRKPLTSSSITKKKKTSALATAVQAFLARDADVSADAGETPAFDRALRVHCRARAAADPLLARGSAWAESVEGEEGGGGFFLRQRGHLSLALPHTKHTFPSTPPPPQTLRPRASWPSPACRATAPWRTWQSALPRASKKQAQPRHNLPAASLPAWARPRPTPWRP